MSRLYWNNQSMLSQKAIDMLQALKQYEGYSSGELSLLLDMDRSDVKAWMRTFEKMGYGTFNIQDGMYHFWFSPWGNEQMGRIED